MLSTFFYSKCLCCSKHLNIYSSNFLCSSCINDIKKITDKCQSCGHPLKTKTSHCAYCDNKMMGKIQYDSIQIVYKYSGGLREVIRKMKFQYYFNSHKFIRQLSDNAEYKDIGADIITTVPSHWTRRITRSTHPAKTLLKSIAKKYPCADSTVNPVTRIKRTNRQSRLNKAERFINILNAFKIDANIVKDKKLIVIDDIFTTGATINELSRALKKAGALEVHVICLCS